MTIIYACVESYHWKNSEFESSMVIALGYEVLMSQFFSGKRLVGISTKIIEDARSQIVCVVIYLHANRPIHSHIFGVCTYDCKRGAFHPKDGFDHVSIVVPDINDAINQHYCQRASLERKDNSTHHTFGKYDDADELIQSDDENSSLFSEDSCVFKLEDYVDYPKGTSKPNFYGLSTITGQFLIYKLW